jgi:hypothetical protein
MNQSDHAEGSRSPELPAWLSVVRKEAASLRFGLIQIKVHDGEIVQIESTRKFRVEDILPESESPPTGHTEAYPPKYSSPNPTRPLAASRRN